MKHSCFGSELIWDLKVVCYLSLGKIAFFLSLEGKYFTQKLEQKFIRFVFNVYLFKMYLLKFTKYNLDLSWIPCKVFASIM